MKRCRFCNLPLAQKPGETLNTFARRHYCNTKCRKDQNNYQAKLKGALLAK